MILTDLAFFGIGLDAILARSIKKNNPKHIELLIAPKSKSKNTTKAIIWKNSIYQIIGLSNYLGQFDFRNLK